MAKKLCALLLCAALVLVLLAETQAYSEGLPSTHRKQRHIPEEELANRIETGQNLSGFPNSSKTQ